MTPSDISVWHVLIRMALAVILGGCIGLEREKRSQAAGLRTHMLVSLGSALVMLISVYGFPVLKPDGQANVDVARIAAQVVSGVGFLGAGTIIRNGMSVKGLTTAASLWVSAAIGLACGSGFYSAALFGCGMSIVALWLLNKYDIKNLVAHRLHDVEIVAVKRDGWMTEIAKQAEACGLTVRSLRVRQERTGVIARVKRELEGIVPVDEPKRQLEQETLELANHDQKVSSANSSLQQEAAASLQGMNAREHEHSVTKKALKIEEMEAVALVHIELKVLAESMTAVSACGESILGLDGVQDVRILG